MTGIVSEGAHCAAWNDEMILLAIAGVNGLRQRNYMIFVGLYISSVRYLSLKGKEVRWEERTRRIIRIFAG